MPLSYVKQGHHSTGCFVACVAMLTRTTYEEAFKLVHPKRKFQSSNHGIKRLDPQEPINIAFKKLKRIGLQPKNTRRNRLVKLDKTAIFFIRWSFAPELIHAVVWDAEAQKVLDPAYSYPLDLASYERQLAEVFIVEPKCHAPSVP